MTRLTIFASCIVCSLSSDGVEHGVDGWEARLDAQASERGLIKLSTYTSRFAYPTTRHVCQGCLPGLAAAIDAVRGAP